MTAPSAADLAATVRRIRWVLRVYENETGGRRAAEAEAELDALLARCEAAEDALSRSQVALSATVAERDEARRQRDYETAKMQAALARVAELEAANEVLETRVARLADMLVGDAA